MMLFTEQINHWDDWWNTFQSISAFTPLITHIMQKENLPIAKIENVTPGTNAVFKVGDYIAKIFAPPELYEDISDGYGTEFNVELFGMKWANAHGVPSPKLIADGVVVDKYHFRYMIMEYVRGKELSKIEGDLSYENKVTIGRNMRKITNQLNLPCENFTPIDVIEYAINNDEWEDEGFPESFRAELLTYLKGFHMGQKVYCHGDLHGDNILVDENMNVSIVDFADAMYAPVEYEQVYIVSGLFEFQRPYMEGYFGGDYAVEEILDLCMTWLPIHAWAHSILAHNIGPATEVTSFAVMRERLSDLITRGKAGENHP
ncbi:MAG: aminoglycoside phosphotransferase family protein [Oscillospiraceae bacterium]|nr:aminoglycoside phosphotransferase family protein [Oscillospiraceae bacterium]